MSASSPTAPAVFSPQGQLATRVVGGLRIGVATATAAALVATGKLLETPSGSTAWLAAGCALIAGVFAFAEISYGGRAARKEEHRIRTRLLQSQFDAAAGSIALETEFSSGQLIAMMTDNAERATEYRQVYFGATLAAMAIPFLTLIYIGAFIDPVVGFGVLLLVPLIPVLIFGFMRLFRKTSAHSRQQRAMLAGRYLDALRNLVTIRLLGAGERIEAELRAQGEANRGAIMRLLAGNQLVIIVTDGLFALVLICATAVLTYTRAAQLSLSEIVAILLLTVLLLEPLQQVAGFFYIGMGGMASRKAIAAYIAATKEVLPPAPTSARTAAPDSQAGVELRDVTFDYGRGPVLDRLNLTVPRGGRIAIVGPSGVGKSTLIKVLQGGLIPQSGQVAVAGYQLGADTAREFRSHSATVAQTTWMFTGTIADNLRIANPHATESAMWVALEQAHVAEEVARMPSGLHTYLGEGAALVSGGQAQRISLARALLSGRQTLLLDEPTSHVDIASQAAIIDAIAALPRDWTIVMVTHREALLPLADTVYELSAGRLNQLERA